MSEKKNVPELRFEGFEDNWETIKIDEMFRITRGNVLAAPLTDGNQSKAKPYPVYSSQTKDNGLMGYYNEYLYENAITWTTDGANAGTVNYRDGKFYCTNVCGVLLADRIAPNQMIAEALNNVAKKYVSYVGNPKLMNNVMAEIEISLPPSESERQSISSLLKSIDTLLTLQQRKCERLKNVKKSMLEKMFPREGSDVPEIRFEGFSGAWERSNLGEIVQFSKGTGYSKADLRESGTPIILYGRLYTRYETVIQDVDTFADEKPASVYSRGGEVIVPASGETAEDISIASVVEQSGILLGGDLNIITPPSNLDSAFLAISISNGKPHRDMAKMAQGKSVVHLHNTDLAKIELKYPCFDEQAQISTYFSHLDHLITLHQQKYEKLNQLKQSLLEKMFV